MEPIIHAEADKLVSSLQDFLSSLPADTKSVQVVMYAYADDYETYNDKTKCVAEGDSWYVLPEDARMELIGKAVTHCLQLAAEVVSAPSETEEEYNEAEEKLGNLREALKSLARSFSLYMENVDTAAVYQNASTRFTDGGQFGLGGELAISTDKLHQRGPIGLQHLVTNKWYIYGDGQIR